MKTIDTYIHEAFRLRDNTKLSGKRKITVNTREELLEIIIKRLSPEKNGDFSDIDVSKIKDFSNLFQNLSFKTINITGWETSQAEDFSSMFDKCDKLEEIIGISDIDTSHVTYMTHMFHKCKKLKRINISNWNVDNLYYANGMFGWCDDLEDIGDLSEWNVQNVKSLREMFVFCNELKHIGDISEWTKRMKFMCNCAEMFYGCTKLKDNGGIPDWYGSDD